MYASIFDWMKPIRACIRNWNFNFKGEAAMETLFSIADSSAHAILYIMALMSVVSNSIMIERYFALKKISSSSNGVAVGFKTLLETKDLNQIVKLSEDTVSLEGRALEHGLT